LNKIAVSIAAGEARANKILSQIEKDKAQRFIFAGYSSDIPGDIQFINPATSGVFNAELKDFTGKEDDNSDLLSSILNGHLYEQTLKLRAAGHPCAVVSLGDEKDMDAAILKSVYSRGKRGEDATDLMIDYENMVFGFEAGCRGQNIGFWWLKKTPYKRLLSNVYHVLTESDLSGYAPKPLRGEEQSVGLSILAGEGIGKAKSDSILEHFQIALLPRHLDCYLNDCPGIGPKLAERVGNALNVPSGMILRPKEKKPRKMAVAKPQRATA